MARLVICGLFAIVSIAVACVVGSALLLAAAGEPALANWLELMALRTGGLTAELWAYVRHASAALKPYAEIIKPLHDIGAFSIAVLIAVFTFLSRHQLKKKFERIKEALGGEPPP